MTHGVECAPIGPLVGPRGMVPVGCKAHLGFPALITLLVQRQDSLVTCVPNRRIEFEDLWSAPPRSARDSSAAAAYFRVEP